MLKDRIFIISLIISLLIHLFLLNSEGFFQFTEQRIDATPSILSIAYYKIRQEIEKIEEIKIETREFKTELETKKIEPKKEPEPCKIGEKLRKPDQEKLIVKKEDFQKEEPIKDKIGKNDIKIDVQERPIQLTSLDLDKLEASPRRPAFIDYYKAIREEIKRTARTIRPDFFNPGQVSLTFKLTCNGNLVRTKIIDEISSRDKLLREIALKSISRASPFPPFPEELDRIEIDFTITISFQPH